MSKLFQLSKLRINNHNPQYIKNVEIHSYLNAFENKIRGTIVENWVKYWKNVYADYKQVALDIKAYTLEKPIRTLFIWSSLGGMVTCALNNPNEVNFKDEFLRCSNSLNLVYADSQNQQTADHLRYIRECYNRRTIRRLNLLVASVLWTDQFSESCNSYESMSPYLKTEYRSFGNRIIDVGFFNRWWILQHKMQNYDINY